MLTIVLKGCLLAFPEASVRLLGAHPARDVRSSYYSE